MFRVAARLKVSYKILTACKNPMILVTVLLSANIFDSGNVILFIDGGGNFLHTLTRTVYLDSKNLCTSISISFPKIILNWLFNQTTHWVILITTILSRPLK